MPDEAQQVIVTTEVVLVNCGVTVAKTDGGGREIQVVDPLGHTVYRIPVGPELSRKLGNELFTAVPIAKPGEVPGL